MTKTYGFLDRLQASQRDELTSKIKDCVKLQFRGVSNVIQSSVENDKNGCDFWLETNGQWLRLDVKFRMDDFFKNASPETFQKGHDDIALENWSVVEKQQIGWSRNTHTTTDLFLCYWIDTDRYCFFPAQFLVTIHDQNWQKWKQEYRTAKQKTPEFGGYHSECTFVPRRIIWAEIYKVFSMVFLPVTN